MPVYRRCNTCHQLYTGKKCPECSKKRDAKYRKKLKEQESHKQNYHLYLWQKCRRNIMLRYMNYDIWLLGAGQTYVMKNEEVIVHHIAERDDMPEYFWNADNLITVCRESHDEIHALYDGSKEDKLRALDRIAAGIRYFNENISENSILGNDMSILDEYRDIVRNGSAEI